LVTNQEAEQERKKEQDKKEAAADKSAKNECMYICARRTSTTKIPMDWSEGSQSYFSFFFFLKILIWEGKGGSAFSCICSFQMVHSIHERRSVWKKEKKKLDRWEGMYAAGEDECKGKAHAKLPIGSTTK
jgi:hypothetical protein